jgi:hypothetical protein
VVDERDLGELEADTADDYFTTVEEKTALMKMKQLGLVRNKEVCKSWNEKTWPFDPISTRGGGQWLRVITEPSVLIDGGRALGRRICELHLNDCLRGDLHSFAPLLTKLSHLKVLFLHDNPSLVGNLENIKFKSLPFLEHLALQRTGIETKKGLDMLSTCHHLIYIDVTACTNINGRIPESLLMRQGLIINVSRSGLADKDRIGNEARSKSKWGKRHLAIVPGAPSMFVGH